MKSKWHLIISNLSDNFRDIEMSAHKLLTSEAFAAVSGWVVPKVGLIIDLWKQIATGQNLSKNAVY